MESKKYLGLKILFLHSASGIMHGRKIAEFKSNQINLLKLKNVRSGCPISRDIGLCKTPEHSGSNRNLGALVFEERGKPEYP